MRKKKKNIHNFPKSMTQKQLNDFSKDPLYSSFCKSLVFNAIQDGTIKLKD